MCLKTTVGFALMISMLAGCQPAMNWRETHPAGAGMVAQFPCKPDVDQRQEKGLAQCETAGKGFALSWADLPDPTQAEAALKAMPQALAGNLGLALPAGVPVAVPGMTPMREAAQFRLAGSGRVVRLAVFAHGGRVYQALMTAEKDDEAAWESFRAGLAMEAAR